MAFSQLQYMHFLLRSLSFSVIELSNCIDATESLDVLRSFVVFPPFSPERNISARKRCSTRIKPSRPAMARRADSAAQKTIDFSPVNVVGASRFFATINLDVKACEMAIIVTYVLFILEMMRSEDFFFFNMKRKRRREREIEYFFSLILMISKIRTFNA